MNIKKGDKVIILKGKDRNKTGKVVDVSPKTGVLTVEGLNMFKKSLRPKREGEKGQVIAVPKPLKFENVMFVCSSCGKPARTGSKVNKDKTKERYCKKCNAIV